MNSQLDKAESKSLDQIVAEYFTGPDVAHQSIMLQMPAKYTYDCAERFFKARAALGITGYMDAKEALKAMAARRNHGRK